MQLLQKISAECPAVSPSAPESVLEWVELIQPDIIRGNACFLVAGKKLNAAKEALRGIQGGFGQLIETLGLDQDKAEGLMRVARHLLLEKMITDSVTSRKIPLGWTVLAELARIRPEILEALIATGGVGPTTTRRKARQLVKACDDNAGDDDHGDAGDDDHGDAGDTVNALLKSPGEADRELEARQAHIDELEAARERDNDLAEQLRLAEIRIADLEGKIVVLEDENATLRAKLEAAQGAASSKIATADTATAGDPGPFPDFLRRKPEVTGASDSSSDFARQTVPPAGQAKPSKTAAGAA